MSFGIARTFTVVLVLFNTECICQEDDPCCPDPWVAATTGSTVRSEPPKAQISLDVNVVQNLLKPVGKKAMAAASKCVEQLFPSNLNNLEFDNNIKYSLTFGGNASVLFDFDSDLNQNTTKILEVIAETIQNGSGNTSNPDLAAGLRASCEVFGGPTDRPEVPNVVFIFISDNTTASEIEEIEAAAECLRDKARIVILTLGDSSDEIKDSAVVEAIIGEDGTVYTCKEFRKKKIFKTEFILKKLVTVFDGPRKIGVCKSKLDVVLLPNTVYKYKENRERMAIKSVVVDIIDTSVSNSDVDRQEDYGRMKDAFKFAVITFVEVGRIQINFDDEINKKLPFESKRLKDDIRTILNLGSLQEETSASFPLGINMTELLLTSQSNRETAPNVVFFITSNDDTKDIEQLPEAASTLRTKTRVVVITVGKDAIQLKSSEVLKTIATPDDIYTSSEFKGKLLKILKDQSLTVCQFVDVPAADVEDFRVKRQLPPLPPRECEIFQGPTQPLDYGRGNTRIMYRHLWNLGKTTYSLCNKTKPQNHICTEAIIKLISRKADNMLLETVNFRDEFFSSELNTKPLVKRYLKRMDSILSKARTNFDLIVNEMSNNPPCIRELMGINSTLNDMGRFQGFVKKCTRRKACKETENIQETG